MEKSILQKMFDDQLEFQTSTIQDGMYPAPTHEERTARTKEMILHLFSEADELLRASGAWKFHRNVPVRENREHIKMEWVDMFKYLLIVAHIQGFTPEELVEAYWIKSMVVRQRFSEEWIKTVNRPSVLIDIDNVLADYIGGFIGWLMTTGRIGAKEYKRLMDARPSYLTPSLLNVSHKEYEDLKHLFRISTMHRYLHTMPGANTLMESIQDMGLQIILLTSRPIHRYPNLYGDTLQWLELRALPYDFVWWAQDKGEEVVNRLPTDMIQFAVDDEYQFVDQLRSRDILTFWFRPSEQPQHVFGEVNDLTVIPELFATYGGTHVSGRRTSTARPAHGGTTTE